MMHKDQTQALQEILNYLIAGIKRPEELLDDPLYEVEKANYSAIREFVGLLTVTASEHIRIQPENIWLLLQLVMDMQFPENPEVKEKLSEKLTGRPTDVFRKLGIGKEGNPVAKLEETLRANLTQSQNGMLIKVLDRI